MFWVGDEQIYYALAVHFCRSHCPVYLECRADAIAHPYRGVVAGGIVWADDESGRSRRSYRRRFTCEICQASITRASVR